MKRLLAAGFLALFLHAGLLLIHFKNSFSRPPAPAVRQVMIDLVDMARPEAPSTVHREKVAEKKPASKPLNQEEPRKTVQPPPVETPAAGLPFLQRSPSRISGRLFSAGKSFGPRNESVGY